MSVPISQLVAKHRGCQPECIATSCRSTNCVVTLPQERAIGVDCDRCKSFNEPGGMRKPDYVGLIFAASDAALYWFVVEMKSRIRDAGAIVEQLQRGAHVIEHDQRFAMQQPAKGFLPIVVKSRGVSNTDNDVLNRSRIRFKGVRYAILMANCGTELNALLPKR